MRCRKVGSVVSVFQSGLPAAEDFSQNQKTEKEVDVTEMKPIPKTYLQSEIIEEIDRHIRENDLKPGDRLPSQQQMADLLGVSRVSLREAMKTLEARNVVEVVNGKGVYYKGGEQPHGNPSSDKEMLLELLQVRQACEQEVIRLVVEFASDEEIAEIGRKAEVIRKRYDEGATEIPEDRAFHDSMYKASHNKLLQEVIRFLGKTYDWIWQNPMGIGRYLNDTIPMHIEMYRYVQARDAKHAQAVNKRMLEDMMRYIQNNY
jgi:GntR family transcriptional repressor for pyruvate dehydrogenase complex